MDYDENKGNLKMALEKVITYDYEKVGDVTELLNIFKKEKRLLQLMKMQKVNFRRCRI